MKFRWLKRYMPRKLYARAALVLVLPVLVVAVVVSVVFVQRHLADVTTQMTQTVSRELGVVGDKMAGAADRAGALAAAAPFLEAFQMQLVLVTPDKVPPGDSTVWYDYSGRVVMRTLRATLPQTLAVQLRDGPRVDVFMDTAQGPAQVTFNRRRLTAAAPHQLIVTMVFFGLLMTLISFAYMRNQLRPITKLAAAAEAFGKGRIVPYAPGGAQEVRAAGGAFLDMRARIERQIEQRTLMLSGVSHDLRTPLTRMKLELSMLDVQEAGPLLRDVDEMQRLVDEFLDFSRGEGEGDPEAVEPIDLVRQVVEDARRAGREVAMGETDGGGTVMLRPFAIRRAVENLVNNAVQYGTRAEVSVVLTDKSLRIRVEDDGPGIPPDDRSEAMKPFTRLVPARNQDRGGGVGLGLAIVSDIARAHGGVLRLMQSESLGGLAADIVIGR